MDGKTLELIGVFVVGVGFSLTFLYFVLKKL
ncbi:hypothetical protein SAMN06265339_1408 [Desulfurobacterium pacificum]|jgi:hypothetical protein|uniref:Hmc operon protein 4 n=1 Tax=Desulfurobacterium pacificum TaxID=240166 RepID=A0ABY1NQW1_9BACT|nr:hypothetical protein SAMN06265339_1408 [Desulfurobacterium pacificum]